MDTSPIRATEMPADPGFVSGISKAIQSVNSIVLEIAATDIPVHISGESGTGKEVYARLIHSLSPRKRAPFKKLSCSMLVPSQLLTQLNAHLRERGEVCPNEPGTIYLDEIDELDLACQKVLLSTLSSGEGEGCQSSRVRLLSSASRRLDTEIESGRFRRELFFRINGVGLRLPPLRERKDDLPELMEWFMSKHSMELRKRAPVLSESELAVLQSHEWPGNIRELENLARRIVALGDAGTPIVELNSSPVPANRAPGGMGGPSLKVAARAASRQAERQLILKALERTHWNRKRAAQELQISYKSLLYKIKQTGVVDSRLGAE